MISYLIHDHEGRIIQTGTIPEDMLALQHVNGGTVMAGVANLNTDYVVDGAVTPRPAQDTRLIAGTLTHLPVPCTIHIDGNAHACTDDVVELEFTYPAAYAVRVEAFPYLDAEFNVVKK